MLREQFVFFRESLFHFKETGTFFPCSRFVAKKLAKYVSSGEEHETGAVVELGAGTGVVTKEILNQIGANQKLLSFEINPRFCEIVGEIEDSRLRVINDCAGNFPRYLDEKVSCVISVLPLSVRAFSDDFRENLFANSWERLEEFGRYVQFQYFPFGRGNYQSLRRHFSETFWESCMLNFPFGWIYGGVKT